MHWNITVVSNGFVKDCSMVIEQQTKDKWSLDIKEAQCDAKTKPLNWDDRNFINTGT